MNIPALVIRYRIPVLIIFILIAVAAGFQLRHITIESDIQKLLPDSMPSRIDTKKIEEIFGGTDMLFIIVEADDVLAASTLHRLKKLDKQFSKIDGVNEVLSLFSTKSITGRDGSMIVEPAVATIPASDTEREQLRRALSDNELASGIVVSKDFHAAAIMLTLAPAASEDEIYRKATEVIDAIPGNEKISFGGQPAFRSILRDDIVRDLALLVPASLIIMLAALFGFFRRFRGVLLPSLTVLLSLLFGVGLLPLFGWKLTLISVLLPIMIVAIANDYGIHLVSHYMEISLKPGKRTGAEISIEILRRLWKPVLVSGLTTIAGILGLLTHIMVPARQIGVTAALAIGFALAVSLLALPAALSLMPVARRRRLSRSTANENDAVHRLLSQTGKTISKRPKTVLAITALLTLAAIGGTFLLKTDANQENLFSKNHPISRTTRLINRNFGGTQNISMQFTGDIKDPALLRRMSSYQNELEKMEGVGGSTSIADVIRIMSKAINDSGTAGWNSIPDSRNAIAQYIELYSMSGDPDDFERMVDFNYENALAIARINNGATPVVKKVVSRIKSIRAEDSTLVRIGGFALNLTELADAMISGQITSLLVAAVAIAVLVMLFFRSFTAGILSIVPLAISVVLSFGIMGFSGLRLDMATAMITSIVIGAGVDYTIHFLWRYRDERRDGRSYKDAVHHTLTTSGKGILYNALSVLAGFAALFLSSLPPLRVFALLFSISIFTCMIGALVVIPCLCLVLKPIFLEPR